MLVQVGCHPIVVVAPGGDLERTRALELDVTIVEGGPTRQESVANGLGAIESEIVLIHDAARPFATAELTAEVLRAVDGVEGAVPAVPVDETIKRVEDDAVIETLDRATLWRVQTPQAFRTTALVEAHRRARSEGFLGTDDAQLIEHFGGSVAVVRGARTNIKITYPEDFPIAETIAEELE
jgi:2-C-methyl-D-erythritol 4-phosphate cytidylyltransferase